jgi:hypothetical protein
MKRSAGAAIKRQVSRNARTLVIGLVAGAFAGGVVAGAGRVMADPIPVDASALAFRGTLTEGGERITGMRNLSVALWSSSSSSAPLSALLCASPVAPVGVVDGRFSVQLPAACVDAIRLHADTWAEVTVEGARYGLQPVGAVPYAVAADNGVPPGTIVPFGGDVIPRGWLLCDGLAFSSSRYPALHDAIGTVWGDGTTDTDSTTNFNVPDLRGQFLRGAHSIAGPDMGRAVGTTEGQMTRLPTVPFVTATDGAHTHLFQRDAQLAGLGGSLYAPNSGSAGGIVPGYVLSGGSAHQHTIESGGDAETRPANAAVNFIIRF